MSTHLRGFYTPRQAAEWLGLSHTTVRALVRSGELRAIPLGRGDKIPSEALDDYKAWLLALPAVPEPRRRRRRRDPFQINAAALPPERARRGA